VDLNTWPPDLAEDMNNDAIVIAYLSSEDVAKEFYSALCNRRWKKINHLPEDELIIEKLKGVDSSVWSCSWRTSGSIIAKIRNTHYYTDEDYISFYWGGNEGIVSDKVKECFERMGWELYPWDD